MLILLFFAFLAGLVTILAPCIWPLLPIVLSSSIGGRGHQRPLGITLGIILSFAFFTLAISFLIHLLHLDPNALRIVAVIVLIVLGIMMVVPSFVGWVESLVSKLNVILVTQSEAWRHPGSRFWPSQNDKGFWSGFVTGIALGIVWSPCAGPILAAIATLSATGKVSLDLVLITAFYVIGVGIPLFIFAYGGQLLIQKSRVLSRFTGRIQQVFGIIMIFTAVAIYFNYDKVIQTQLLDAFPVLTHGIQNIDNNPTVAKQLADLKKQKQINFVDNNGLFNVDYPAPELVGITQWLNNPNGSGKDAKPLTIKSLRGKVVLIDFWTYTCINCIRTLPFLTTWYDKYKDDGFVVIGVHTPEFAFEHDTNNVLAAIKQFHIHYPVAQDNDNATWDAYNNEYWPAEYLIDAQGHIRRTHFGEGEYDQTEKAIQALLKEAGKTTPTNIVDMPDETPQSELSPETYLGSYRMQFYYPYGHLDPEIHDFGPVVTPDQDTFSLGGNWTIAQQNIVAGKGANLEYIFTAQKVFLVLAPAGDANGIVKVYLDGKAISSFDAGSDVKDGLITVDSDRLYNLVDLHGKTETHLLRLDFLTPGTQAYAFTFG